MPRFLPEHKSSSDARRGAAACWSGRFVLCLRAGRTRRSSRRFLITTMFSSKAWEPVRRNRSIGLSIARETSWRCGPNSLHWWQKRLQRAWSSPKPIRLYYSGEVLRFEKPKGGRQREFAQIGIEHYGASGKTADVEILLIAVETFQRLGIQAFQINLGSVDFFGGIVDRMELPADRIAELKDVLNVKDRSGLEALLERLPLGDRRKKILRAVPHLTGGK